MKFLAILFISFFTLISNAQFDWDSKKWNMTSLGFGCSVSGEMTIPVQKMTQYFVERDFNKIREALNSNHSAYQFLAAFLLQKLSEKKELQISDEELLRISQIKKTDKSVPVCAGCTYWTEVSLKSLFEEDNVIYTSANYWFKNYYKTYYKKKSKNIIP